MSASPGWPASSTSITSTVVVRIYMRRSVRLLSSFLAFLRVQLPSLIPRVPCWWTAPLPPHPSRAVCTSRSLLNTVKQYSTQPRARAQRRACSAQRLIDFASSKCGAGFRIEQQQAREVVVVTLLVVMLDSVPAQVFRPPPGAASAATEDERSNLLGR
jgi:hypothetical protein